MFEDYPDVSKLEQSIPTGGSIQILLLQSFCSFSVSYRVQRKFRYHKMARNITKNGWIFSLGLLPRAYVLTYRNLLCLQLSL
jgi:hypothetical protein